MYSWDKTFFFLDTVGVLWNSLFGFEFDDISARIVIFDPVKYQCTKESKDSELKVRKGLFMHFKGR